MGGDGVWVRGESFCETIGVSGELVCVVTGVVLVISFAGAGEGKGVEVHVGIDSVGLGEWVEERVERDSGHHSSMSSVREVDD